jgi:hypothetical protein
MLPAVWRVSGRAVLSRRRRSAAFHPLELTCPRSDVAPTALLVAATEIQHAPPSSVRAASIVTETCQPGTSWGLCRVLLRPVVNARVMPASVVKTLLLHAARDHSRAVRPEDLLPLLDDLLIVAEQEADSILTDVLAQCVPANAPACIAALSQRVLCRPVVVDGAAGAARPALRLRLVHFVGRALATVSREQLGSRGFFTAQCPSVAAALAAVLAAPDLALTKSDEQLAIATAVSLVAVSRLASLDAIGWTFDWLPEWLQLRAEVASRHLGTCAFALRHRLGLPSDGDLRPFIVQSTSVTSSTIASGTSSLSGHTLVRGAGDDTHAARVSTLVTYLLDSEISEGDAAGVLDGVRHGIASLLGLNQNATALEHCAKLELKSEGNGTARGRLHPASAQSPHTDRHWTSVETYRRRGELATALDAALALGRSRGDVRWAAVPSLIVETFERLSNDVGRPDLWKAAYTNSATASCGANATKLLERLVAATASFGNNDLTPQVAVQLAVRGFGIWLALQADRVAGSSSQSSISVEQAVLAMASALAAVAPAVSLEAATGYCVDVCRALCSSGRRDQVDVAALAVWRVADALQHTPLASSLALALRTGVARSGSSASEVVQAIPLFAAMAPAAANEQAPGNAAGVWTCGSCGNKHGSATSACGRCNAPRWPGITCQCCHAVRTLPERLSAAALPEKLSSGGAVPSIASASSASPADGCYRCGAELGSTRGAILSSVCSACKRRVVNRDPSKPARCWCPHCGHVPESSKPRLVPDAWACGVCQGLNAFDTRTCGHCSTGFVRLPVSPTVAWDAVVKRTVSCPNCRISHVDFLLPKCPTCDFALPPRQLLHENGATSAADLLAVSTAGSLHTEAYMVWVCGSCLAASSTDATECRECHAARSSQVAPSHPLLGTRPHVQWACTRCKSLQSKSNCSPLCEVCSTVAGHASRNTTVDGVAEWQLIPLARALLRVASTAGVNFHTLADGIVALSRGLGRSSRMLSYLRDSPDQQPTVLDVKLAALVVSITAELVARASAVSVTLGTKSKRQLACAAHALGALINVRVLPVERCVHCAGTHPEALCPVGPVKEWKCQDCGAANTNAGTTRYVCGTCLYVRPALTELSWSDAWECQSCKRVSCECDDSCAFCGEVRAEVAAAAESSAADANSPTHGSNAEFDSSTAAYDTTVPFFPARCGACGGAHLEALCVECNRDDAVRDQIRRGQATVLGLLPDGSAEMQPHGTPELRVIVPADIVASSLGPRKRVVGTSVTFDADVQGMGNDRRLYATSVTRKA